MAPIQLNFNMDDEYKDRELTPVGTYPAVCIKAVMQHGTKSDPSRDMLVLSLALTGPDGEKYDERVNLLIPKREDFGMVNGFDKGANFVNRIKKAYQSFGLVAEGSSLDEAIFVGLECHVKVDSPRKDGGLPEVSFV